MLALSSTIIGKDMETRAKGVKAPSAARGF